ncbi:MAG: hypothetical protein H7145_06400 [Akkermansiaceae bacterium]|nr:hypothetical protein [Armatimonadota bacterium]
MTLSRNHQSQRGVYFTVITPRFSRVVSCLLFGLLAVGTPCFAQDGVVPPSAPQKEPKKRIIDLVRYDPRTQGPLLLVVPRNVSAEYDDADRAAYSEKWSAGVTLSRFGEIMACRTLTDGNLTALVPRTMTTIVSDPPDPDPTAGMQAEERFRLLLGTLTPAQWQIMGGSTGIGTGDLTDEQKPLFAGLFPAEGLTVATMEERANDDQPGQTFWADTGESNTVPVRGVRLRVRRQVLVEFLDPKDGSRNASSTPGEREDRYRFRTPEGEERSVGVTNDWQLLAVPPDDADGTRIAFGQTVVRVEQNRAKPSDLPVDAPAFGIGMRLDGSEKTVGELLSRCAKETRMPLVADKRLAALPLAWRVAPGGQTASVASVLRLLCRSVTGTFRRLDLPNGAQTVYLLTDDREGYGTRLARLYRWGQRAEDARDALLRKAKTNAAKGDPLSHVQFAPDDPMALPPALDASLETAYRTTDAGGIPVPPAELPPALRDAVAKSVRWWKDYGRDVNVGNMRIGATLTCDYVLPDGRAFEAMWGRYSQTDYLRSVAKTKPVATVAPVKPTPAPAPPVPRSTPRRVCVLPLPDGDGLKPLLVLARRKGFTEVLFRVSLYDARTPDRLKRAVALGKSLGIPVGASAPWLKRGAGESMGIEDVNVSGETGRRWIADEMSRMTRQTNEMGAELGVPVTLDKQTDRMFALAGAYLGDWIVPDARIAREPLSAVLSVTDLSAFVLTDTAAPGWDREMTDSNDSLPGALLGCTPATRIACIRSQGFDPVDVYDASLRPPFTVPELHFGPENLTGPMTAFRVGENRRELAALLGPVAGRAVPVYVEEYKPFISGIGAGYIRHREDATSSSETLAVYRPFMEYEPSAITAALAAFARTAPKTGFVADFGRDSVADATRCLNALADK